MVSQQYLKRRRKLSGLFFETALPNEYLVTIGKKTIKPVLGGRKFKMFKKFLRVPAYVQRLHFKTDNANVDYQGIGIEGYASWRINPGKPEVAIATLDFFDDNDPMERTNNELKTICIEAVRHVIANMSIDDALRKKDEIGDNLRIQLKEIEAKWVIIFDQVGIEKVTIMSDRLFKDLQSEYRNKLRLNSERTRITTDREILRQKNETEEKSMLEKLESDQKIELVKINNSTVVKERELKEEQNISIKKREIREADYRQEMKFKMEQEQKQQELQTLEKNLQLELGELETKLLSSEIKLQELRNKIATSELDVEKLKRYINQIYTDQELTKLFISKLPEIYQAIQIDNYSVLDSNGEKSLTPVGKIFNELIFALKNSGFNWFTNEKES